MSDEYESIHVLMGKALADVPAIGKNSTAPGNMGGYKFRGIEDVTAALKPIFAKYGIFVVPRTDERIATERTVGNNKTMYCIDVHVAFQFFGPAGDTVEADTWGQGTDMGDKATQKAYTSAFKSMLIINFLIADENDDAERHDVPDTVGARSGPTPDEEAQAQGWTDDAQRKQVHDALKPGLKKLVDEGQLSQEVATGLWAGKPMSPMTKQQFDTWIEGVERAKSEHAENAQQNEQAAEQVKEEFGAEDVTPAADTPTA